MAALRCGSRTGHRRHPASCQAIVAGFEPSYMTLPLPDAEGQISADAREPMAAAAMKASVLAYGPGLGRSAELTELIAWLYQTLDKPAVVDADALNALAERQDVLCRPGGPRILTPHPGEFARLAKIDHVPDDQRQAAGHGTGTPHRCRRAAQGTSHRDYRRRPTWRSTPRAILAWPAAAAATC